MYITLMYGSFHDNDVDEYRYKYLNTDIVFKYKNIGGFPKNYILEKYKVTKVIIFNSANINKSLTECLIELYDNLPFSEKNSLIHMSFIDGNDPMSAIHNFNSIRQGFTKLDYEYLKQRGYYEIILSLIYNYQFD